jgi:NAD+-dependent secondary alcohol dehydrogenase Adh1
VGWITVLNLSCIVRPPAPCRLAYMEAQGKVKLHTSKYPLDELQRALDDLDAERVRGRAILVP